ncbi:alpha/beta fold hydrolase [Geodermatophilus sp. CPCC 206100]|uniref:alpha/beta fold hydrolase n=1 Tax=Geodermatophilus sp. CPCC 206100 TaxID=3020054 RepID=UPI003B00825D
MTTRSEELRQLEAADGVRLVYRRWLPEGAVRGTVQVVHGASEHSGRYARLAGALTARGIAVAALDLRGHGRTAEATGPGRFGPGGGAALTADVRALQEVAAAEHPGVPRVLLGHSMGSVVALAAAEESGGDLAGLVLTGPIGVAPHLAESVAVLEASVAAGAGDASLDALGAFNQPFEPARTPFDWLSRDPAEVDAYLADPYCGDRMPLTTAYAAGVFGLSVRAASEEGVAALPAGLPVLLLAGRRDPVGGVDAAQVTALAGLLTARGLPVELHVYEDARHEVLNETNRDEVTADLLTWLDARLGG